jgi:hypothetical protein
MPKLEAGGWQPEVTVEVRPTEVRLLLSARPDANRDELVAPHAALRGRDAALLDESEPPGLHWLEDGSDRCYLIAWQASGADEKLEELIDPAADDALIIWFT